MNVQQWREMSALIDRLVAVGCSDVVWGNSSALLAEAWCWFPNSGECLEGDRIRVQLALSELDGTQSVVHACFNDGNLWFDSAAEAVEWVEACHVAACFALLEAAGFERGPWGEWHKDGCLIQPHARYGEPRFDIYTPRRPSDWGPLRSTNMQRADRVLEKTFTNLDLQTLLEFRGWPTAEQVEADEKADRLAALLSPEHLAQIDAVLAEVDAGILPDDGVPADVSLEKVRQAAEG